MWQIEGVPGFITTTHRDECSLCEQYAEHAVADSKKPTVEIPSHRIELAFRTVWPRVVERIEDDAVDEAHGKLSWYRDRYQDAVKNAKSLQEQLDSEKECHRKAESKLHDPRKEVKGKGKQKETSASSTCEWREWESEDQDRTASVAPSVQHQCCRIPKCLANCKSDEGHRTHPQTTCDHQSHKQTRKGTSPCQYHTPFRDTYRYCKGTCRRNASMDSQ